MVADRVVARRTGTEPGLQAGSSLPQHAWRPAWGHLGGPPDRPGGTPARL